METLIGTRELALEQEITSVIPPSNSPSIQQPSLPQISIQNVIEKILPKQSEENKFAKTRQALGETAQSLSNEQIETITTEFQFLIESWLDEYEREVFKGLTLKEVLNERRL